MSKPVLEISQKRCVTIKECSSTGLLTNNTKQTTSVKNMSVKTVWRKIIRGIWCHRSRDVRTLTKTQLKCIFAYWILWKIRGRRLNNSITKQARYYGRRLFETTIHGWVVPWRILITMVKFRNTILSHWLIFKLFRIVFS